MRCPFGDVAAALGIRGDLGGSLVRAGESDVEVAAWPAERLGVELARAVPPVAGEDRRIAEVLAVAEAPFAMPAGVAEPGNADARADAAYVGTGEVETRRWTEKHGDDEVTYYDADVYRVDAIEAVIERSRPATFAAALAACR